MNVLLRMFLLRKGLRKIMRTIWTEGVYWEKYGIMNLLTERGMSVQPLTPGRHPSPKDVVILAYSSAPLMGWSRYLYLMDNIAQKYSCTVVVLHPPGMGVIPRTPRTYLCNGLVPVDVLFSELMRIMSGRYDKKTQVEKSSPAKPGLTKLTDLLALSNQFRQTDSLLLSRSPKKECAVIYRKRQTLTTRAGFRCIHLFRIFITGVYFPRLLGH